MGTAQQIIENPAKPLSANAGRVVGLKEIARITDEKGKFLFVQPFHVLTGLDGSVYVQEYQQLLKFDAQGRFVRNLLKRGQGPGELDDNLTDVLVREKDIILWSSNNYKFIRLDLDGRLIEDRRLVQGFLGSLLGAFGGRSFFLRYEIDAAKPRARISGISEEPRRLVIVPDNGEAVPTPILMPVTEAIHFGTRGVSMSTISRAMPVAAGENRVFLFHTPGYLVKLLDLETGEVVRSFRREYGRVRYEVQTPPGYPVELVPKFHNDLCRLLWRDGRLWAVTSTFDKNKGILVDVFSPEGKYLDNFYLPIFKIRRNNPQYYAPMAVWGNILYLLEADEDDIITMIKYEIVGE
ncbi:MAG: 6-bladed beta-propeller [Candidatus Moduliflexus flocculans]|nr:6-bladed beta-propeller [Candidatus Moduliflexus flocculans]